MEGKKRYGRIQHVPFSLDLAPFDFASFPQLKSDLQGIRLTTHRIRFKKKIWFGDIYGKWVSTTQEMRATPGRVF